MVISGSVKDKKTGSVLPAASVYVSDANGKAIGTGILADDKGNFTIDSKQLDDPTSFIGVSYTGYKDSVFQPGSKGPYTITLEPTDALDAVVVTAKKKVQQASQKTGVPTWVWWTAGGIAVISLATWLILRKKKK